MKLITSLAIALLVPSGYAADLFALTANDVVRISPNHSQFHIKLRGTLPSSIAVNSRGEIFGLVIERDGPNKTLKTTKIVQYSESKPPVTFCSLPPMGGLNTRPTSIAFDHNDILWVPCYDGNKLARINSAGIVINQIPIPYFDAAGTTFVRFDSNNKAYIKSGNLKDISSLDASNPIAFGAPGNPGFTDFVLTKQGDAIVSMPKMLKLITPEKLYLPLKTSINPTYIAISDDQILYFCEESTRTIESVDPNGHQSTFATAITGITQLVFPFLKK